MYLLNVSYISIKTYSFNVHFLSDHKYKYFMIWPLILVEFLRIQTLHVSLHLINEFTFSCFPYLRIIITRSNKVIAK